ncbi:MAG: Fic family protein [Verrucomicrobia bacterium]|nr:Fic family protein [Verrucomicrobiota bacterium]
MRSYEQKPSIFRQESLKVIEQVRRPIYERQPISYSKEWLDAYEPNSTYYVPASLRDQLLQAGKRNDHQDPAGTYAHKIFNRLLIDLSYNSSRLEGNTYSLLDTERLLLQGASAEGKLDEEKVMILNHKEAIRYLVDHAAHLEVNKETICTLHYLLAADLVEPRYAGKVRDHGVRIGGSTYLPFEDSQRLQIQLERVAKKGALIRDPFEQSLFLLAHVSYLQAFVDVNKRTARLCANIPLIPKNLAPLSFNDLEREDYMSAMLAIYELQEIRPLVDLYAYSYLRTCAAYDATIQAVGFDEMRIRYRQQRRAVVREVILQKIFGVRLKEYIHAEAKKQIPQEHQIAFEEDVFEDLELMDVSRLAGLGVTPEQLDVWLKLGRGGI